jgi:hypothetical protein
MFPVTRTRGIRAFWRKIGNSIAASAQAPKVNFLSTAETFDDEPACYCARIGRSFCSHKIKFSFLNGNLMVPAGHLIIFD